MPEYLLYITGEFVQSASKRTFESINPFDRQVVARVALAGEEDARRAAASARKAFDEGPWRSFSGEQRSALIKAVADKINERKTDLERRELDDSASPSRTAKEDSYI